MTRHAHPAAGGHGSWWDLLPVAVAAALAVAYLAGAGRARRPWPRHRTAFFTAGCALLALAPSVMGHAHADLRGHMLRHLLIGMYAPLCLVLGAPVTLLLNVLSVPRARRLTALLHTRWARLLAHPVVALVLSAGSLPLLYFTPLYALATASPAGHALLHAHFLAAGCLFAWVIAGPDPAPARPGVPARLVVLGAAITVHAVTAQLMYGGFFLGTRAPAGQVRTAAEIMYYFGDIAELLLAVALVATWRPGRPARPLLTP